MFIVAHCFLVLSFLYFFYYYYFFPSAFSGSISLMQSVSQIWWNVELSQPLREWADKMSHFEHVILVTTGEVCSVLYPELLLWANLMCLPQSLFWLPPCRIFLSLALEGFWLTNIKHELLRLPIAVDGPKHRPRVCVVSHLVVLTILLRTVKTDPASVVRGNLYLQPTQLTPPGHKCLYWHHTLF